MRAGGKLRPVFFADGVGFGEPQANPSMAAFGRRHARLRLTPANSSFRRGPEFSDDTLCSNVRAGASGLSLANQRCGHWIPACAGMTGLERRA